MNYDSTRIVVSFKEWDRPKIREIIRECGGKAMMETPMLKLVVVKVEPSEASDAFLAYSNHPAVADVSFSLNHKMT